MLFKARAFKSPSIDCPERLYSLKVLKGLNEQPLPLRDEKKDEFIFCEAVREAQGVRIARELQLSSGSVRFRMKVGGEITGFGQVLKPYNLRDGAAKGLNESPDVSDSLQNKILQHATLPVPGPGWYTGLSSYYPPTTDSAPDIFRSRLLLAPGYWPLKMLDGQRS